MIVVIQPEATSVLDEILGNQTDLLIAEHANDTAGATLVNFALLDLVDLLFSPRIRDLGKITLCRTATKAEALSRYPRGGSLLSRRANEALIANQWDDLLRLAASLKFGHTTASLVVGKLSALGPQNTLAAAPPRCDACASAGPRTHPTQERPCPTRPSTTSATAGRRASKAGWTSMSERTSSAGGPRS